ncbi:unnamed protein product, partial [Didymodactylos carnosus]
DQSAASGDLNSAELYDPSAGAWTPTGDSMNITRQYHTGAVLTDGKVLVAGGVGMGISLDRRIQPIPRY